MKYIKSTKPDDIKNCKATKREYFHEVLFQVHVEHHQDFFLLSPEQVSQTSTGHHAVRLP